MTDNQWPSSIDTPDVEDEWIEQGGRVFGLPWSKRTAAYIGGRAVRIYGTPGYWRVGGVDVRGFLWLDITESGMLQRVHWSEIVEVAPPMGMLDYQEENNA